MATPSAQMKSPLVPSYLPGRTLLSILLCELFCGRGMETSHFPSPSRGRERYRPSGHEAACAGNTRLFARAEAARVTAMLLLVASGSKGPVVPLAVSLRIQAARSAAKRHPAVLPLLLTRPAATPAARTARDSVQEALREAGLAADEAARAERLISAADLGFAASEAAGRFRHHAQQVIDEDFAVLLRWLRLALTSKSPTER
jgi:hypothetical protein